MSIFDFDISRILALLDRVRSPLTVAAFIAALVAYIVIFVLAKDELSPQLVYLTIVGAVLVIAAAAVNLLIANRRSARVAPQDAPFSSVQYYNLSEDHGRTFYERIIDSYRHASGAIYISGRGFKEVTSKSDFYPIFTRYLEAYEDALRRGVKIVRIQTSEHFSQEWGGRVLDMLKTYPNSFELYVDINDAPLVNVAVIDPDSEKAEVHLLFESQRFSGTSTYFGAVSGAIIVNQSNLASGLRDGFIARVSGGLRRLTPENWEQHFSKYYFSYGSNIDLKRLKARCPSAEKVSRGLLYDWKLVLDVVAEHIGGAVAGIAQEPGEIVEGMLFLLSPTDMNQLRLIEEGGYSPRQVVIKTENGEFNAVTFVPEQYRRDRNIQISQAYVERLLVAARENNLRRLERDIESIVHDP